MASVSGCTDHVVFVNQYLTYDELLTQLKASDVFAKLLRAAYPDRPTPSDEFLRTRPLPPVGTSVWIEQSEIADKKFKKICDSLSALPASVGNSVETPLRKRQQGADG